MGKRDRKQRKPRSRRLVESVLYTTDHQAEANYWGWLNSKHRARQIIDEIKDRPYWLSIEYDGSIPVSGVYPCKMFRHGDRVYYGFLYREHREKVFDNFYKLNPYKELTGDNNGPLL